jgi:Divergent InlB B-repeat domain
VPITVQLSGSGIGQVNGVGVAIACGSDCNETVAVGSTITLQASASPGSQFDGWGGVCQGLSTSCTVTVQAASTVVASFVPPQSLDQAVDAVIAAMPPNSWKALPNTRLGSVCPAPYQGYYCTSVVTAWSGGAGHTRRDRMIVYGGGHSDSFYNIMFSFDLATMRWERLNEMGGGATGDTPGTGWTDIRFESCGFYPRGLVGNLPSDVMLRQNTNYIDPAKCFTEPVLSLLDLQQPRSAHTYGKVVVDWLRDRYCYIGGDTFPSSQMDSYVAYCLDPHSRTWSLVAERPYVATGRGNAAMDASGNWWYLTDGNANILKYDPTANQWTEYGNVNFETGGGADIDRLRNQMYAMVVAGDSYVMRRFDLDSSAALNARPAYTQLTGVVGTPSNLGTRPGLVYADNRDRFFAWGGGANVHAFDPQTLSWTTLAGTGDTPGAQQTNGTFGRWRYSAARRVFVLVNSTTQDVYLYKPPN